MDLILRMVRHSTYYAGQGFKSLFHMSLTVTAGHPCHDKIFFQGSARHLFRRFFLLGSGFLNGDRPHFYMVLCLISRSIMDLRKVQAQGIHADRKARQAHSSGAHHGVHLNAGDETRGKRNADDIVEEGPEKIFVDVPDGYCG